MGILGRAVALSIVVSACYSPDLRDCTVSCTAAGDCASGQVCGAAGFCAAPDVSCSVSDAGVPVRDAADRDAAAIVVVDAAPDAPPDAPTTSTLHVHIDGQGSVTVTGVGTCAAGPPQQGDCNFSVLPNLPLIASASPYPDWRFDKWTSATCAMESSQTCTFAAHGGTTNLTLKFRKAD